VANITEKAVLVATVVVLVFLSVADLLDLTDRTPWISERIPTITLLLLSLFAGYWLVEQNREKELMRRIEELTSQRSIDAKIIRTTESAMGYLAQRFSEAQISVDQAAISPSLPLRSYIKYDQFLLKVLKKNNVKYRHVVLLDKVRWGRARSFLLNQDINKYFIRYYESSDKSLPGMYPPHNW
jgi:hypothetical protein